jgi:hypothetical protein
MAKFKKNQEVVVEDKDKAYVGVIAEVGDKKVKVTFGKGAKAKTIAYPLAQVFDKTEYENQEEEVEEEPVVIKKKGAKKEDKVEEELDLDLSDIDESIDNDLNELGAGEDEPLDDEPVKAKGKGKKVTEEVEEEEDLSNVDDEPVKSKGKKTAEVDDDTDDWFAVGDDEDSSTFSNPVNSTFRFGLKESESALVTFITGKPLTLKEHNMRVNGKWGTNRTCLTPAGQRCPLCEAGKRAATIKVFFVVDHRKVTSKDGKVYQNQVRVLVLKQKAYKIFKTVYLDYFDNAEDIDLTGLRIKATRSTADKSPGSGDIFVCKESGVKLLPEWKKNKDGKAYDIAALKEEFKPRDYKELARLVNLVDDVNDNE